MALESALLFETPEQIYERVFRDLRPRTPPPRVEVRFKPFANANAHARWADGVLQVSIADVLRDAPAPVVEALAYILLSKMFRKTPPPEYAHRYKRYLSRRDVRGAIEKTRQLRGRKLVLDPRGAMYDLERMFDELNLKYFFGLMPRPALGWSLRPSRGILGHYDEPHNTIVVSRLLDRAQVPAVAVEYVLFHEMLHIRYPVEHRGTRRCVHTPEFKAAEKRFERLAEAKAALAILPRP